MDADLVPPPGVQQVDLWFPRGDYESLSWLTDLELGQDDRQRFRNRPARVIDNRSRMADALMAIEAVTVTTAGASAPRLRGSEAVLDLIRSPVGRPPVAVVIRAPPDLEVSHGPLVGAEVRIVGVGSLSMTNPAISYRTNRSRSHQPRSTPRGVASEAHQE